ncbi:MAG: sensor histidine kinase [Halanaeroarchaeum sp.]
MARRWRRRTVYPIGVFGVLTLAASVLHLLEEGPDLAILTGVVPPIVLSIGFIAAAWFLADADLEDPCYRRVLAWTVAGAVVLTGLGSALLLYQVAHGAALHDGEFIVVNWMATGALLGFLIGYYDVRRLRVEDALRREHDRLLERERQLERENERLDRFASIVSHDLRNPLTVAQGRLELARETGDEAHLAAVASAHERMETIVAEMLDLAREGAQVADAERTTCSLARVARASWDTVATADATLEVESDLSMWADESRLRTVFENCFRNAIDHAGEDVTVRVGALPDDDGFFIADDGPGVDPDVPIFEAGVTTDEDGTGLGLSIVEEIVTAHGWHVDVVGSAAGGARFVVRFDHGGD